MMSLHITNMYILPELTETIHKSCTLYGYGYLEAIKQVFGEILEK